MLDAGLSWEENGFVFAELAPGRAAKAVPVRLMPEG
jgi:hypothetical protein